MPTPLINNKGTIILITMILSFLVMLLLTSFATLLIQEAQVLTYLKDSLKVQSSLMSGLELGLYQIINKNIVSFNKNYDLNGVKLNLNINNNPVQTIRVTGEVNRAKRQLTVIGEVFNLLDFVFITENLESDKQLNIIGKGLSKISNKTDSSLITNNFRPLTSSILKMDLSNPGSDYFVYNDMMSLLSDSQRVSFTHTGNSLQINFLEKEPGLPDVFVINNPNLLLNGTLTLKGSSNGTIIILNQDFHTSYPLEFDKIMLIIKDKAFFKGDVSGNGVLIAEEFNFSNSVHFNGMIIAKNLKFERQTTLVNNKAVYEKFEHLLVKKLFIFKEWRYQP
ncbi:MAG: hypothetical protein DDT42_00059 [candidate division WS2 bacterium]|uniref:Uncharacterized protein n=1 Tax=Psychracetigena formicireducens TaxID=2986056 RepID=A0A9E2BEW4_PSYF1|nr:hypothetical protein [Candidatus Psychracetigena formicireducens]MBT9144227.1 hypothetical protein [Candidatus Psychracetigena formicireducens]